MVPLQDTIYQATLWTLVEPCIGITCGCLPILRGLFHVSALQSGLGSKVIEYLTTSRSGTSSTSKTDSSGSRTKYVNLKNSDIDRQRRNREVSIETRSEELQDTRLGGMFGEYRETGTAA